MIETMEFTLDGYVYPVKAGKANGRIYFDFPFNRDIMDEIRVMEGAQYHGFDGAPNQEWALSLFNKSKIWSVKDCERNNFQLERLRGGNPYLKYDSLDDSDIKCPEGMWDHQNDFYRHGMHVHYGIWAGEMGTGKTLPAIRLMENSGTDKWWYVAPRSAMKSVQEELREWKSLVTPKMFTYAGLVKEVNNLTEIPQGVIFDESQKIKTPTAKRSKAAKELADAIREGWGDLGYVILMTGTPAPRSPVDWWHQAEVACPGFLREGKQKAFQLRLGLFEKQESLAGGSYMSRKTWLDDPSKCKVCGETQAEHIGADHKWTESNDEVSLLSKRLEGLVVVKLKKDCMDLPDKMYRTIVCEPAPSIIRAAKLITKNAARTIEALTNCRELSDGFQYKKEESGTTECSDCLATGKVSDFKLKPKYETSTGVPEMSDDDYLLSTAEYHNKFFDPCLIDCHTCGGSGQAPKIVRKVERVPCPKDDVVKEVLDEHSDVGRLVIYAGFSASVERCVEIAQENKWATIKWDGKGIEIKNADGIKIPVSKNGDSNINEVNPLTMFQKMQEQYPRVCFIGNAGAAGTGLNLTASPSILYYSNSFNSDDRIQSEDRIHRAGMDYNRGATIIDIIHLPTDKYVLSNLKEKRNLQSKSMGEIESLFEELLV